MAEVDIKVVNETVKGLDEVIKSKLEKIKDLESQERTVQDRIHRAEIKKDQDKRNEDTTISRKLIEDRNKLEADRSAFMSSMKGFDLREAELDRRTIDLEKREKEVVDIDKAHRKLNEEKVNFNLYKVNKEREFQEAEITIAEAREQEKRLQGIRDELEGKEATIKGELDILSTERGDIEIQRAELRKETEYLEGLKKWYEENKKEVVNEQVGAGLEEVG